MENNKVLNAINKTATMIKSRLDNGQVTQEQIDKLHCSLDMPLDEYCSFQDLKSLAMMHNKLTLDEANTIYGYLGNTPEYFNSQGIGVKVVLTKIFAELLDWKLKKRAA